jgi:DNA helicase MCM8
VQEIASTDLGVGGRIPRTVDVELLDDLVDTCSAGDVVTIVGFVKVINTEQDQGEID